MTSEPSLLDYAYLAGLVDGEGHLRIQQGKERKGGRNYPRWNSSITIGMCDAAPVKWCRTKFGGSLTSRQLKNPRHRDLHEWAVYGRAASQLAEKLLPFLQLKREQAVLLLEYEMFKIDLRRLASGRRGVLPRTTKAIETQEGRRRENVSQRLRLLTKRGA